MSEGTFSDVASHIVLGIVFLQTHFFVLFCVRGCFFVCFLLLFFSCCCCCFSFVCFFCCCFFCCCFFFFFVFVFFFFFFLVFLVVVCFCRSHGRGSSYQFYYLHGWRV